MKSSVWKSHFIGSNDVVCVCMCHCYLMVFGGLEKNMLVLFYSWSLIAQADVNIIPSRLIPSSVSY